MTSPAEQRPADQNLPVVLLTVHDVLRIAAGHPMTTDTAKVRLFTAEEFMRAHLAARDETGPDTEHLPAAITFDQAKGLTRPVDLDALAKSLIDERDRETARANQADRDRGEAEWKLAKLQIKLKELAENGGV